MVKVAFYKGRTTAWNNFWADLIRWWTGGPYSHVEISVRQNADGQSFCYSSVFKEHGVRGEWKDLNPTDWDIVEVGMDPEVVETWFKPRLGCKYDLIGLLGFILRRDEYDQDKYFCSEAVADSLGIADGWRYDPNALKPIVDLLSKHYKE